MGFLTLTDRILLDPNVTYEQNQPGKVFRRWSVRTGSMKVLAQIGGPQGAAPLLAMLEADPPREIRAAGEEQVVGIAHVAQSAEFRITHVVGWILAAFSFQSTHRLHIAAFAGLAAAAAALSGFAAG